MISTARGVSVQQLCRQGSLLLLATASSDDGTVFFSFCSDDTTPPHLELEFDGNRALYRRGVQPTFHVRQLCLPTLNGLSDWTGEDGSCFSCSSLSST